MSMTLSQMADFVTKKVGQFDATSLALCKSFIQARNRMIFDSYFWQDSQISTSVSVTAGSSSFPMPDNFERVVTIKLGVDKFLDPVNETFLIESDPSVYDGPGEPAYYTENAESSPAPSVPPNSIKLFPTPDSDITLYVFGKKVCPAMEADGDVSILRNCDNAIMAFAIADMLERARQYAKAQAKFQEANALLDEAKSVEKDQANQPRKTKNLTVAGNSLLEMTDAVCALAGQWTPDMRILVKDFLRRNYLALYDLCIWPETTVAVRVTSSGEQVVLPEWVDRVIAVRGGDNLSLFPAEISHFFNVNPFVFEDSGTPVSFSMLTPCGVAILPPSAPEKLIVQSTDSRDAKKKIFVKGESHGTEVTEELTLVSAAPAPSLPTATTLYEYDVPITVAKPITKGNVTVNGVTSGANLEVIAPNEREKKHIRLWILPSPTSNQTVLVLGKRKVKPLMTDEDTPIISDCQNILISGAAADLFMKLGNGEQAKAMQTKAQAAAQVLVSLNTEQNAYMPRFIPAVEPPAFMVDEYCFSKG